MFCNSCARTVEQRVERLACVKEADLSFGTRLLSMRVAPGFDAESAALVVEAEIRQAGFTARRQERGWLGGLEKQLEQERERGVPAWLVATVGFFAMWSSMVALALYLGHLQPWEEWLLALLSTLLGAPALLLGSGPFALAGWRSLRHGRLTLDAFIALGAASALVLSLGRLSDGYPQTYADSSAMILVVLLLAKWVEARIAGGVAGQVLFHVQSLGQRVRRLESGRLADVEARDLRLGDQVVFFGGEMIAVDGVLVGEPASTDSHLLDGEDGERQIHAGDPVLAGAIATGPLTLQVSAPVGERLIDSWAEAALLSQSRSLRRKALLRRWEQMVTWAALVGAGVLSLSAGWKSGSLVQAGNAFFTGVLIFCPCLFASILPLAQRLAQVGLLRRRTLLMRPDSLFELATVEHWAFDKTGTLEAVHTTFQPFEEGLEATLHPRLEALRRLAIHPLLKGLPVLAQGPNVGPGGEPRVEETPGEGAMAAWSDGETLWVGRPRYLSARTGLVLSESEDTMVCWRGRVVGRLIGRHKHLERSRGALLELLEDPCLSVQILSGDPRADAGLHWEQLAVGRNLSYRGGLSPSDKADLIPPRCAFVGDGLNDTLAMARAAVSLRIGARGLAPADIQLLDADLRRLPELRRYALRFRWVVLRTVAMAATYNLLAWTLAGLELFTPLGAVLAMLTSLTLMLVSIRPLAESPAAG
jgi:cation transport ATPase